MTHLSQSLLKPRPEYSSAAATSALAVQALAQSEMDTPDQAQRARYVHTPGARQHAALARADIGLRIRELREARGLSQRQAGGDWVSRSFMSRLESGERLVGVTVLQALTLSMPDVRFVIEAGEVCIEERLDEEADELTGAAQERTLVNDVEFG